MQLHNNIMCITGSELMSVVGDNVYRHLSNRKQMNVIQRACYGKPALIEYASLPTRFKKHFKVPSTGSSFKDKVKADSAAVEFYSHYLLADGRNLDDRYQRQYAADAAVLNALRDIYNNMKAMRNKLSSGVRGFWKDALKAVEECRNDVGHNLPGSEAKLKVKYKEYCNNGYVALVSKKFCNDNSRKVDELLERVIMGLYTRPNKPYGSMVHDDYLLFLNELIEVYDNKTGELFNPADFVRNGKRLEISKSTVWNVINQPKNAVILSKSRSGHHYFNSNERPHTHRHAPNYSFSKISMDDRDLPRLLIDGGRVKAYYTIDVTSGCFIGWAYSRDKNERLVIDCFQNTFRQIEQNGFPMPLQVEVENHLMNKFKDVLDVMFPFVRFCNATNSQEKYAEPMIKVKKYVTEKKTQTGIGRHYLKSDSNRVDRDKVNDEFVEKAYTYERLVADDIAANMAHNNTVHPNIKKYKGKTRWEVLVENINPNAAKVAKPVVYKAIGECTTTSIVRNQYVQVQYAKYQLPTVDILDRLQPGNYNVEAYYLPDAEGVIGEVYLYQNGSYLCKCEKIETFNRAVAERTEKDEAARKKQNEYIAEFDIKVKRGVKELPNMVINKTEVMQEAMAQEVKVVKPIAIETDDIDAMLAAHNPADYAAIARQQL